MNPGKTTNIYQSLPSGAYFRYLVLQPGNENEDLICTLHISSLQTAPPFEAISYVWGSDVKDQEIICNGEKVNITTNLRLALVRVRKPNEPRTLWADSICINQNDPGERSHQVSIMAKIYINAERALVHMGPDPGKCGPDVSSMLSELDTMIQKTLATLDYSWNCFPTIEKEEQDRLARDPRWKSFKALTSAPWFGRGWVVQEVGLAKQALILWGDAEFSWHALIRCYFWFIRRATAGLMQFQLSNIHLEISKARYKREIQTLFIEASWFCPGLLKILEYARCLGMKDERDRFYAFIELANSLEEPDKAIAWDADYTKHYLDVYSDFAHRYVSSREDVTILHYVQHSDESINDGRVASWVPRWNIDLFAQSVYHPTDPPVVPATEDQLASWKPSCRGPNTLVVKGVLFDRVRFSSQALTQTEPIDTIVAIWKTITAPGSPLAYSTSHISLAFMSTLVIGSWWGERNAWEAQRTAYIGRLNGGPPNDTLDSFHAQIQRFVQNRRFIVTERGYFGLAPLVAEPDDMSSIIFGAGTPFLLREAGQSGQYKVVGDMWLPSKTVASNASGNLIAPMIGDNRSRDWVELGLDAEDILLC